MPEDFCKSKTWFNDKKFLIFRPNIVYLGIFRLYFVAKFCTKTKIIGFITKTTLFGPCG